MKHPNSQQKPFVQLLVGVILGCLAAGPRITSYNVCYTKLLRPAGHEVAVAAAQQENLWQLSQEAVLEITE